MRILGIDPGEKRIGFALSDPSGKFAKGLTLIKHISRDQDVKMILKVAAENDVNIIIIGQATDLDGKPNYSGRRAGRLAGAIRNQSDIIVELWDESYTTQDARKAHIQTGGRPKNRKGHLDELSAAIILQSFLDTNNNN